MKYQFHKMLFTLLTISLSGIAGAVTSGAGEATLLIDSNWNSGYCASVTISNNGNTNITSWTVTLGLNGSSINNLWSGNLSGNSVTPASYNALVAPGNSVNFGFCANGSATPTISGFNVGGGGVNTSSSSSSSSSTSSSSSSSSSSSGGSNSVTVRMRGVVGDESVSLQIGGQTVQTWTATTNMMDYTASTNATGQLRVAFTNDSGDRDVQLDYVIVNGAVYQAEDQQDNTGAYSGSCGGGSYSEWLHCNGSVGFGDPWNPGSSSSSSSSSSGGPTPSFFVGNITTSGNVRSDFVQYWDQITPENEGKWSSVEGTRDSYNWSGVDRAYNYARSNGIAFKQHTFVWGNQSPSWINNLSAAEQRAEIEEWIRDFCARYPDTDMIDVVNESTPGHAPAGYAQNAFGNNWIIRVFEIARQHCPNSILILNDYNVLRWNTNEFIQMATPAVNAGVVDALGLQAHGLETLSLSELQNNLNRIAALGLPIYISEYDVARTNDQEQLQIMQQQFPVFYNHPSVKGITLWGYVVGRTWVDGSGLIHENGTRRPAMNWLMNYLGR